MPAHKTDLGPFLAKMTDCITILL